MENNNGNILQVDELKTYFPVKKGFLRRVVGYVRAVDGVSFRIKRGKSLGLVGESGCGKTTLARTLVRLVPAMDGNVSFQGQDLLAAQGRKLRRLRRDISIIFQDPYGSLNPRMTVADIVGEPLTVHYGIKGEKLLRKVAQLLEKVGLSIDHINRYPHEFSGGQRQRIGIARALALEPKLVICDEPVSALDVSIQSQILNLLKDLQDELGLTYLFIAHDLAVVEFFCDEIAVMYMGRIVEHAPRNELYRNPLHPYTQTLISAIPDVKGKQKKRKKAPVRQAHDITQMEKGCPFAPRCELRNEQCEQQRPKLQRTDTDESHYVACWKSQELSRRNQENLR